MSFSFHDVKEAYQKLRTYIYYDNTDILLRRKLVEFETNCSKDVLGSLFGNNQTPYRREETDIFKGDKNFTLDEKLEQFANALNDNHKAPEFSVPAGSVSDDPAKECLFETNSAFLQGTKSTSA